MKKHRWAIVISFIIISLILFFYGYDKIVQTVKPLTTKDIFALQLSFSRARFVQIIQSWRERQVLDNFLGHFKYDFMYLSGYTLLLICLFVLLGYLTKNGKIKLWAFMPLAAGIMDSTENVLEIWIIKTHSFISPAIFLQSLAALTKFLLIAFSIVLIVWISIKYWQSKFKGKLHTNT